MEINSLMRKPTRRRALAGLAASLAAVACASLTKAHGQEPAMTQKPSSGAHKERTAIHYEMDFKASPQRIYEAILDQKQFAAFSGMAAVIDRAPGGAFSMFGGQIVGRNVELVPSQRIVQAWRPASWEPGLYSLVRFEFKPGTAGCSMVFDHTSFPAGDYDHLDWGWHNHYWDPLNKFFAA